MESQLLYTKGTRVWLPCKHTVWKSGVVVQYTPGKDIVIKDEEGNQKTIVVKDGKASLPPLRNPDILTMENNLTTMSYLHEPAVLHSLNQRFTQSNAIYTYCGIVLVAINPYCDVPLYGNEMIWAYKGQPMGHLDPHIYAVSEDAYSEMKTLGRNQSIIVSGESGAGKTVSAKYAMRYFATVAGNENETAIERRILSTNPIMEALGNAKTIRNDNSSRFGKYVELEFDSSTNIIGAHMCTYLLEKSRVVFQAMNERNYHIFYQLCAVRDMPEMEYLKLKDPKEFHFINQGEAIEIDNVDDSEQFYEMSQALFNLGVSEAQQLFMYSVLAGLLHMGNVEINEERNDSCSVKASESLQVGSKLLGLKADDLTKWLCHKKLVTRNETVVMTLKASEARAGLEAFVKHIYASLFLWIVKHINTALSCGKQKATNYIGILDIYGFELFEINSFEQFCINYANEKLQQQFNQHVFKLEQQEYIKEEITWSFIDFTDNQPCIDLIERKMGILDLLDEQCRMNRGTDENWVQILYSQHTEHNNFQKPKTGTQEFVIIHYADNVSYTCHGFINKNLDSVNDVHINLLRSSSLDMVADVFVEHSATITSPKKVAKSSGRAGTMPKDKTVGAQFKTSLNLLMDALTATVPHFIRCIKPNDDKAPFEFVSDRVVQQLRACGVIETVRISAAGYPSRWSYEEFIERYQILVHSSTMKRGQLMKNCSSVLEAVVSDTDKYQFGKTKIFFRAGQVAYFERLRSERLFSACVMMQTYVRRWLAMNRYTKMKKAALRIQCQVRGMIARKAVHVKRQTKAATTVQRHVRGWVQRQRYRRLRYTVLYVQSAYRGSIARKAFLQLKYDLNARVIQKHIRGWLARCQYQKHVRKVVLIQACVRRHLAKKQLKKLKVEARSIGHFKSMNVKLEKKVYELQLKSKDVEADKLVLIDETRDRMDEIILLKKQLAHETRHSKQLSDNLTSTTNDLNDLKKSCLEMKLELSKKNRENEVIPDLTSRVERLEEELRQAREEAVTTHNASQRTVVELEKAHAAERLSEREHHQNKVRENNELQRQLLELQTITELKIQKEEEEEAQESHDENIDLNNQLDSNERNRLESMIIENVQLKEDLDRTSDELNEALEDLNIIRTRFSTMEERVAKTKDSLIKEVSSSRNPKHAQDKIKSQMDQLRLVMFSDVVKLSKSKAVTEEDVRLQVTVETLAGDNIKLLDEITALQNSMPDSPMTVNGTGKPFNRQESFSSPRHKKKDFSGMLICKKEDDNKLVKRLITQLKTEVVTGPGSLPGLPAHIMFMCVRYADHCNDESRIQELLTAMITGITSVSRKQSKDSVILIFWMSNCLTLLHDLTQFSGEEPYHSRISPYMQEYALKNYDLSDYRNLLSDQCVNIYHTIVKTIQDDLQPMIVSGMLEHDSIPGMASTTSFSGGRKKSTTDSHDTISIINRLQFYLQLMSTQSVSFSIIKQLVRQVLYFINASLVNTLLLRKDLCHWSKGIQIRYNLSQVEQWVREQNMDIEDTLVLDSLSEIRQASQLLQMNKSSNDNAAAICETCHSLNPLQIQKLLTLYSPSSEFEERVPQSIIKFVLNYKAIEPGVKLMMDPNKLQAVVFNFEPKEIDLTMLDLPDGLHLKFLDRF